jgi:hypothetical protein
MSILSRPFAASIAVLAISVAPAQPPPQRGTIEERVAALEAGLASLDTRFGLERTRSGDDAGQTELALASRVQALERTIERLAVDLQRAQRTAEDAARAASAAQRAADQAVREATLRR